ncbi:MAG: hypothetical protein GY898_20645 [Proteobacteria bacterium]|nr:hypothetical protein [Pseudomonadota bacterium]
MRNFNLTALFALITLIAFASACTPQYTVDSYVPDEPGLGDDDDSATDDDDEQEPIEDDDGTEPPVDDDDDDDVVEPPLAAEQDNDTFDDPLFVESFLGSGAPRIIEVADAISFLDGDSEDWVAFTTPALENEDVNITLDLICDGEGDVDAAAAHPWDDEGSSPTQLQAGFRVNCNDVETMLLETNHDYLVRIQFPNGAEPGTYVAWDLAISW